jgi:hypothetical protein
MQYVVTWDIDIEADSPEEAAQAAEAIQRDPDSTAKVFAVRDTAGNVITVDFLK